MSYLSDDDRVTLKYLAKQTGLLWGAVYKRGGEPDLIRLQQRGLIEAIDQPYTVGKATFPGGYRITEAGRRSLQEGKSK